MPKKTTRPKRVVNLHGDVAMHKAVFADHQDKLTALLAGVEIIKSKVETVEAQQGQLSAQVKELHGQYNEALEMVTATSLRLNGHAETIQKVKDDNVIGKVDELSKFRERIEKFGLAIIAFVVFGVLGAAVTFGIRSSEGGKLDQIMRDNKAIMEALKITGESK
jgi:hypothetical protein